MKKTVTLVRSLMLAALANPGIFVLVAFTVSGMFMMGGLAEIRGLIELNVILPWGLALALLRLYRAHDRGVRLRADVCALLVLFGWLVVPFALRFGPTGTNINTWQNYATIFFGVFAMIAEEDTRRFGRQLDVALALFGVVCFVFSGALLYCAATVRNFSTPYSQFGFGVYQYAQLCAEQHYNATGMLAMCGAFVCLMGAARSRKSALRALYLIPAVMMSLVVVLSQSRTARYSLLAGLAVGAYGAVASRGWNPRAIVRHAAALLAGAAVLVGGYAAASMATDAALAHYAKARPAVQTVVTTEEAALPEASEAEEAPVQARGAGEGTFTGRTGVWKNIFTMWKSNPKYFLIGNGVGRTGREILIGTPLEHGGANMAHNAYIQFTMDQGLAAFVLLCAFFALLAPAAVRVLFGAPGRVMAGSRAMCMLAVGCLLTGMMENEPLNAMRPCNVMLFFALAVIAHAGTKENIANPKD